MQRFALVLAWMLTACLDEHHGSDVKGSPADVMTLPGDYTGYQVLTHCTAAGVAVGVIGRGSTALAGDAILTAGRELYARIADIESIWGSGGLGVTCEAGTVGTQVALDDWRDVDEVIALTGRWLLERDYDLGVGIVIAARPVPVAE